MRLLHTADWHLGKRLLGFDRLGETREVLLEIRDIAEREHVDAILVAGDLLDRRLVEPEVLGALLEALEALGQVAPVVAVTGNHDDPAFWVPLSRFLAPRNIWMRSRFDDLVELPTADGPLHIACLPWPDPRSIESAIGAASRVAHGAYAESVASLISDYAERLRQARTDRGGAAVLMGHLMVATAKAGGGERELTLGDTYAVQRERLPQDLDYVALGHIHLAQRVPGLHGEGRYCGSPMQLDFGEAGVDPRVAIVEIGHEVRVREVPIAAGRRLVKLRGTVDDVAMQAKEHPNAHFWCEIDLERAIPDLVHVVREVIPTALKVTPRYAEAARSSGTSDDITEAAAPDVLAQYAWWYEERQRALDPSQIAAFARSVHETQTPEL